MPKKKMGIDEVRKNLTETKQKLEKELGKPPTISAICKRASISRAYLYASYPILVRELLAPSKMLRDDSIKKMLISLRHENEELKMTNKILARSCIELKLALTSLQNKRNRQKKK